MEHLGDNIFCGTEQIPLLHFTGTHKNPHGVWILIKHEHLQLYTKIGHEKCDIRKIPYTCVKCTTTLENTWTHGVLHILQPFYYSVK